MSIAGAAVTPSRIRQTGSPRCHHRGIDFSNYFLPLSSKVATHTLAEAKKEGAVLAWGNFLTIALNFLIIAWVLFLAIRGPSYLQKMAKSEPAPPSPEVQLLTEIRDLLKK